MKMLKASSITITAIILFLLSCALVFAASKHGGADIDKEQELIEERMAAREAEKSTERKIAYVIPIEGDIEKGLAFFVHRSIQAAEANNADAIILNIKTFGGGLEAAVMIRDHLIETKIPTYSFINKTRAISAGALIALATKHIYMAEGSSIGDALPIMSAPGQEGKQAPRKIIDYLRKEFKATAERNGHPTELAEGMVDPEFEIEGLKEKGTILSLTTKEAVEHKLVEGVVDSFDELLDAMGFTGADIRSVELSTAEKIARLLSSPSYSWIFLAIGILGVYIEIKTPGFGLPGITGIIFLSFFFWGHNIAGLTGMEEVALFIVGVVLLAVEIFAIPGFGIVGLVGITCMFLSLILAMFKFPPRPFPFDFWRLIAPVRTLGVSTVWIVILGYILSKYLPKSRLWRRLSLQEEFSAAKGFVSADTRHELIGRTGVALSPIRPAGTIMIDGRRVDVISEGDFIDADSEVTITDIQGAKVTVKAS